VGALTRGTYTLRIVDPILFIKNFVPATYFTSNTVFDFTDLNNDAATQLFNEVISALAPAFSKYTNDPAKTRITQIQSDSLGFAQSLGAAVEEGYSWKANRGLEIVSTAIISIEYDADTTELLSKVKRADALSGSRGNSNLQASVAQGFESAGESSGSAGLVGLGMAAGTVGLGGLQQPATPAAAAAAPAAAPAAAAAPASEDPIAKLTQAKQMLDAGLITQDDYDTLKNKLLGS
jgi:membrane protease subunit (stomatin/prohibitin family)